MASSSQGYFAQTANVGPIGDSIVTKPSGSGQQLIGPSIPGAVASTSANTGSGVPYYTKSSSTVIVLNMPTTPSWTTGSLMGLFWVDGSGDPQYCLDCTMTIATNAVTITAPSTIPTGQINFASITAGTTVVTFSLATLLTADTPNNPDIVSYTIPIADLLQLLLTNNQTGGFELFAQPVGVLGNTSGTWLSSGPTLTVSGAGWVTNALAGLKFTIGGNPYTCVSNTATVATMSGAGSTASATVTWSITSPNLVLTWNYAYKGNFYNWVIGQAAAPYAGNIVKIRLYNSSTQTQNMFVGAQMA